MNTFICKNIHTSDIRLNNGNIVRPDGFGVLLFTSGKGKVSCNDVTYHLEEHFLFVFTPYTTFYLEEGNDDMTGWLLEADIKNTMLLLENIPADKRVTISQFPCVKLSEPQENILKDMISIVQRKMEDKLSPSIDNLHEKELSLLRQALCMEIIQAYFNSVQVFGKPAKRGNILFNKFISSVYNNCLTQRTVSFYARQQNISTGRFSAVIREVSGKSAMYWIELFTMTKIRKMLLDSEDSIKEITEKMGFPDQSTFGRYFKAHEGMSPSEYRLQQNRKHSDKITK